MQPTELQMRKEKNGLMAEGLLLGLSVGNVLVSTEYWLLRGGELGVRVLRALLTRPLWLAAVCGTLAAGAVAIEFHAEHDFAKALSARTDETSILNAAALYRAETSRWPARLESLVPQYLQELPSDPWGRNYSLFRGEGGFAVVSAGPDGQNGTSDDVVAVVSNRKLSCPNWCATGGDPGGLEAWGCPRLVPNQDGVRIAALGPGLLAAAGLEQNDVLTKVNGIRFSGPDAFLEAYARLRDDDRFNLEIIRGGKLVHLVIDRAWIAARLQEQ